MLMLGFSQKNIIFFIFVMEQLLCLTALEIQSKYNLPKIAAKTIVQANRSISQRNSALHLLYPNQIFSIKEQYDLERESRVKNTKYRKKLKDEKTYKIDLVSEKMRKYKPTNGSSSQFYANCQLMEHRNSQPHLPVDQVVKDIYCIKRSSRKERRIHTDRSVVQAEEIFGKKALPIVEKLKKIRENSELLREKSQELLKKTDTVFVQNSQKYEKLKADSQAMTNDEEKLEMDEQLQRQRSKKKNLIKVGKLL